MNKEDILKALKAAKEKAKQRKFAQSVDLIVNLKGLNLKKPEEQLDFLADLKNDKGKKAKVCALIGRESENAAKDGADTIILQEEFEKYSRDKKLVKKLADEHDFFVAQANLMGQVATTFGRILGPKGKMPNPREGCVVPPRTALAQLYKRLQKAVKVKARTVPMVQCMVGKENMNDEELIDNISTVYEQIVSRLPGNEENIKSVFIKLTMGQPVRVK